MANSTSHQQYKYMKQAIRYIEVRIRGGLPLNSARHTPPRSLTSLFCLPLVGMLRISQYEKAGNLKGNNINTVIL